MKNPAVLFLFYLITVFIISGCKTQQSSFKNKSNAGNIGNSKIIGDTLSISSKNELCLIQVKNKNSKELWIGNKRNNTRGEIMVLGNQDGIKSPVWSPNGKHLAFVVFNTEGHSPLTTTHVWISDDTGENVKELILPPPDERFSTFSPKWKSDDSLIVRAATLNPTKEQKYLYIFETGKIEKFNSN